MAYSIDMKINVDAYLSEELISEDRLRLELYRRLAQCNDSAEVYEIGSEIEDRFGRLDTPTKQFIEIMAMKPLAKKKKIKKISSYEQRVFMEFIDERKDRVVLESDSKDDDSIIAVAMQYLKR